MTDEEKLEAIRKAVIYFWDEHSECHDNDVEEVAIECITKIGKILHGDLDD